MNSDDSNAMIKHTDNVTDYVYKTFERHGSQHLSLDESVLFKRWSVVVVAAGSYQICLGLCTIKDSCP